jgi:hypothetical protein
MEVMLLKSPSGSLVPMGEDEAESLKRIKSGSVVRCQISEMRNGKFFRKFWALAKLAFDLSSERMQPRQHKGVDVLPCFDEFRKDLVILAGYYEATYKFDGTLRLKAKSLKWSEMTEETFAAMYSACIDAVLQKILPGMDGEELDRAVEQTLAYA